MIKIKRININHEREPLLAPFGFKGGYLTELWQAIALAQSDDDNLGLGLGTQSTLWSDPGVFSAVPEHIGNSMMYLMTAAALRAARDTTFETPLDLLDQLTPAIHRYGREVTMNPDLRPTFVLNSLVPVDNAAWQLYGAAHGMETFDDLLPEECRGALSYRHTELASVPLISYGVPVEEVIRYAREGFPLLKIKVGSDPDGDGDPEKMLTWDKARLSAIHCAVKDYESRHTASGHIAYYLDANGRYDSKERLMRFIDHAMQIGALDRILILEEPFAEDLHIDVRNLPVRVAADESAHSDQDALERIQMGYSAIALKPIAKTLSMSLKILCMAHQHGVPCFCADLTVNPVLLEWNKNVAARLSPLPGMKVGVLESNGPQNYTNWDLMRTFHPRHPAPWMAPVGPIFHLDEDFYACSGGIFEMSKHYRSLV